MNRRLIIAVGLVVAVVAVVLLVSGGDSSSNGYRVRAIFDNGAFMVTGEQVRVAGANVGTIESVDVSMPGETVAYRKGKPVAVPGKAIIVMNISDPGFQDFRRDASCQIRPQSLIGEKFVDCRPTLPRAPGSPPPPPLKQIPEGQPGAGEYLLPLGSNGTSVDPDLINDIQTLPYAQRFRLIFNELGAGLAGRGEDLEVLVKRANPVLRDVDRLFGILSAQRDQLAQLASDSDTILKPFAARAGPRRRLLHQRWRGGPGQLRTRRRTGSLAAQVPHLPARVPPHHAQPAGLLRRRRPRLHRPRQGGPVADRRDSDADPVLRSDDGGVEEPGRDRRSVRADLPRSRTDRAQDDRTLEERRRPRRANWRTF